MATANNGYDIGTILTIGGIISGWILFGLEFYYFRNEKFYLWANRALLKYFKKTYTDWQLKARYEIKEYKSSQSLFSSIKIFFENYFKDYKVKTQIENNCRIRITVNDEIIYEYLLESDPSEENDTLWLNTLKHRVISSDYEEELNKITMLLDAFLRELLCVKTTSYMLTVNFKDNNPYYGFMVRHVPMQRLQTFLLKFRVSNQEDTIISAEKKALTFDSKNILALRDTMLKYLRLEQSLYTVN